MQTTDYEKQAQGFLDKHGIKFRATLSDSKVATWGEDGKHGHHYRVTLSRPKDAPALYRAPVDNFPQSMRPNRVVFDFWASVADMEAGKTTTTPYDVLSCISGDVHCPETFAEFTSEYGYDKDSIKALQMFRRCSSFSKRLRAFFTAQELEDLSEIQ